MVTGFPLAGGLGVMVTFLIVLISLGVPVKSYYEVLVTPLQYCTVGVWQLAYHSWSTSIDCFFSLARQV